MIQSFGLSVYPLSTEYREQLIRTGVAPTSYLSLSQLRAGGILQGLRMLTLVWRQRCFLIFDEESTEVLLPVIATAALLSLPRTITVVRGNSRGEKLPLTAALASVVNLVHGTLRGVLATWRARGELGRLAQMSRMPNPPRMERGRILYLNANLWFGVTVGGSVGHVAGVVNAFDQRGVYVDLATAPDPIMIRQSVRVIPLRPTAPLGLPLEFNYYAFQQDVVARLNEPSSTQYAFVYQRLSVGNYAGAVLARSMRIPLVLEYNGSEVWAARNWGRPLRREALALAAEDASFRHATLIVTVSEPLVRELRGRGVESERIVCYPNCVDPAVFDPGRYVDRDRARLRARYGIAEDAVVATFVGTFGSWHGVEVLARVIRSMWRDHRPWIEQNRLHFLLLGDGRKMPEVRQILSEAGDLATLAGRVPQSEAPLHLAASDILVSPHVPNPDGTEFFGSPTKLFEYMVMGKGIAASRLGQIESVLQPAVNVDELPSAAPTADEARVAVLVKPGNEDDLKQALQFLVERPDWRNCLGSNARSRALTKFTWSHHVEAILGAIQRKALR